jgi:para-nitrobenzyl esterase
LIGVGLKLTGAMAIGSLGARGALAEPAVDRPVVNTANGRLRGIGTPKLNVFKGIRYAKAARFSPPIPAQPWSGVRDAVAVGSPCPQHNLDSLPWHDPVPPSEDCLFLNVWSPKGARKAPVMVWIHGGAFTWGSGGAPMYDPTSVVERGDVVVVTLNHRLNAFGYLYLAGLSPEFAHSTNLGHLDLREALRWVQRNIAAFGGDPDNVTVFGESGGGLKISALLAMPQAKGLFQRAIVQSGSLPRLRSQDEATAEARALLRELGLTDADVAQLRTIAPERLVAAYDAIAQRHGYWSIPNLPFSVVQDSATAPYQLNDPAALALWKDISLLVGTTEAESVFPFFMEGSVPQPADDAAMQAAIVKRIERVSPATAHGLIEAYRASMPAADGQQLLVAITTGQWMRADAVHQAEHKLAAGGAPAYMYQFAWKEPIMGGRWAVHGADLEFLFDKLDVNSLFVDGDTVPAERAKLDPAGDRFRLRDAMIAAWTNFAHHGRPDTPLLPAWPSYTLAERATMRLDGKSTLIADPYGPAVRELERPF